MDAGLEDATRHRSTTIPFPHTQQPMPANRSILGACPRCQHRIPAAQLLIEYETDNGQAVWAECPDCNEVVHPTEP